MANGTFAVNRDGHYATFDKNDPALSQINNLDERYRKQLDPYLTYSYKLGWWDKIGNWLGFNTAEDKYRMEQQDRARLALAGIENDAFQNDYNSAMEQAARQREAGLNPDLSGEASGEPAAQLEQPLAPIDSSIFEVPNFLPDLVSLFGTAFGSLQSVASFKNLMSAAKNTAAMTAGVEISNVDQAYDFAGKYLAAFDPDIRKKYPDMELTPKFFQNTVIPDKIQSLSQAFPTLKGKSLELLKSGLEARRNDPRLYDEFYKAASASDESRADYLAKEDVFGSYRVIDDVVRENNSIMYRYKVEALKYQLQANKILAQYDIQKYQNDFDFERFKTKYKLPENLVQTQLKQYITERSRYAMEQTKIRLSQDYLNFIDKLYKSNSRDPYAQYICQAMMMNQYAPMMNAAASGGAFGVNGSASWQYPFVPGADTSPFSPVSNSPVPTLNRAVPVDQRYHRVKSGFIYNLGGGSR